MRTTVLSGKMRRTSCSTRSVPTPLNFIVGLPHSGHVAGGVNSRPQKWQRHFPYRSCRFSVMSHRSHLTTNPHCRQLTCGENPRRLINRITCSSRLMLSAIAVLSRSEM
jgi:hypothetical protein